MTVSKHTVGLDRQTRRIGATGFQKNEIYQPGKDSFRNELVVTGK